MTFPSVAATNQGTGASSTEHTCNLPADIAAGDLLLLHFGTNTGFTFAGGNPPAGWTEKFKFPNTGPFDDHALLARVADGNEGATVVVDTTNAEISWHISGRISAATWVGSLDGVEVSENTTGDSHDADPASLTPAFGLADTMWLALAMRNHSAAPGSFPTNYDDNQITQGITGAAGAWATRELAATSEDPGIFQYSGPVREWSAVTVAIQGAEGGGGVTGSGDLSAQAATVSGSGVSGSSGSGTPAAQAAQVDGAGASESTGTGALAVQASAVSGEGLSLSTGTGALSAQAAAVAGEGTSESSGAGALAAQEAAAAGEGTSESPGNGALASQAAAVDGEGISASTGTGDLVSGDSSVAGSEGVPEITGTGALQAGAASVSGEGASLSDGSGVLQAGEVTIFGEGISLSTGTGSLSAEASTLEGLGVSLSIGEGDLQAQDAVITGTQAVSVDIDTRGKVQFERDLSDGAIDFDRPDFTGDIDF